MLRRTPRMTVISLVCEDVGGIVPFVFFGGLRAETLRLNRLEPCSAEAIIPLTRGIGLQDTAYMITLPFGEVLTGNLVWSNAKR